MSVAHKNQNFFLSTTHSSSAYFETWHLHPISYSNVNDYDWSKKKRKIMFLGLHEHFSKIATISKISILKRSLNQFADSLIPCMTQLTKINLHFLIVCKSLNKENELVTMHPYQRLSKKSRFPWINTNRMFN